MLNELRSQRVTLSIEVDRARRWRKSAALDQIKQSLEARLTTLDKAIKVEAERVAIDKAAANAPSPVEVQEA